MTRGAAGDTVEVFVDGMRHQVTAGVSVLEACDSAGAYVPRLCAHGSDWGDVVEHGSGDLHVSECGLCVVGVEDDAAAAAHGRRLGEGASSQTIKLACRTGVSQGMRIRTAGEDLVALRRQRLAAIMAGHPQVCLVCPDRDGCARTSCTFGHPPELRCCDELGRCEIGELFLHLGLHGETAGAGEGLAASREVVVEGRIRRELGLCVGCGRCLVVCQCTGLGGGALEWAPDGRVRPKGDSLRASGCTFCGQCVLVCPSGAFTAPGEAGRAWLATRRERAGLPSVVRPPEDRRLLEAAMVAAVPQEAGVFRLLDGRGRILLISGVADLREGLTSALREPTVQGAEYFTIDLDPMYTQRESELLTAYTQEHGCLPCGNDIDDDLFDDD